MIENRVERGKTPVMEKSALLVRPESLERRCSVTPVRRSVGLKIINPERVCKIVAKEAVADLDYLKYALAIILKRVEDRTPFVTVKHLSFEDLKEEPISIPNLSDQRRIAAQLDQADLLRRTRRYALELSDGFLSAAFLEMFGDPVRNPKSWTQFSFWTYARILHMVLTIRRIVSNLAFLSSHQKTYVRLDLT